MSNNQQVNQQAVVTKPPNFFSSHKALILGALSILIISTILIAFIYFNVKKGVMSEEELPIKLSILQNPVIYEWQGSVEGVLVEKNDKNFTLEKDGKKITISIKKDYTAFYKQGATGSANLTIKDVPEGAMVRGIIWLASKGKLALTGVADDIVGGTFSFSTPQKE